MSDQPMEVWGKACVISFEQRSKAVWVAFEGYEGQPIDVKDQTRGGAINRWREAARYRGNG